MNAYNLAKILLAGNDYPIVIRIGRAHAEIVKDIFVLQNCDSPYEYAILLESKKSFNECELIDVDSI